MRTVSESSALGPAELYRYHRQTLLPELRVAGQEKLRRARVLLVGAGGLGSPAALYLAAAGIGTLVVVDDDRVDETNLQRQLLYTTMDVGRAKPEVAHERLRALNPHVSVEALDVRLSPANARRLVAEATVVIDGADNFPTRYLVNDACVLERRPNVFGSIARFEGQASVFAAPGGPCYRCLHPEPPPDGLIPDCGTAGVLGVLPGVIGAIQATEAIKLIAGIGETLTGRMLLYDALRMRVRQITIPRDSECPVCGDAPTIRELVAYDWVCAPEDEASIAPEILALWRREHRLHVLLDVRERSEHALHAIPGALLIPLNELEAQIDVLPKDRPVVVHCQSGSRSRSATAKLRARGFDARNLTGGIAAWARLHDNSVTRY